MHTADSVARFSLLAHSSQCQGSVGKLTLAIPIGDAASDVGGAIFVVSKVRPEIVGSSKMMRCGQTFKVILKKTIKGKQELHLD